MANLRNPLPIFIDHRGALLDGGSIYVGRPGTDPEVAANQLGLYWDAPRTVPAQQPLRTLGGVIQNDGNPAPVFLAEEDYAVTINDVNGRRVSYTPSTFIATATSSGSFQPLDSDLTAIAALSTTSFGRSLLTMANATALRTAAGVSPGLPLSGGTMTGNILRQGAGLHPYFASTAMTGGRIFGPNPVGTADATSQPGDIQVFY